MCSFLGLRLRYCDARVFKSLGSKVIAEAWGSDVRLPELERERNPYYVAVGERDDRARESMSVWAEITAGHVVTFDPGLADYLKLYFADVHRVPQRVDTQRLVPQYPDPESKEPLLVHAPSNPVVKGTEVIRTVVTRLRKRGFPLRYVELQQRPHSEVLEALASADLVIDQIRLGTHGVFALEAMALGKPVVCYIREDLRPQYPADLPIINANPDTLEDVLAEWLRAGQQRYELGRKSRQYVERVHDYRIVANRLVEVYSQLP